MNVTFYNLQGSSQPAQQDEMQGKRPPEETHHSRKLHLKPFDLGIENFQMNERIQTTLF